MRSSECRKAASLNADVRMSTPIFTFKGLLTQQDFIDIDRYVIPYLPIRIIQIAFAPVALFVIYVGIYALRQSWYTLPAFALILLLAAIPYYYPTFRRRSAIARYQKAQARLKEATVAIGSEQISVKSENFSATFKWELLGQVIQAPTGLYFISKDKLLMFSLPSRILNESVTDTLLKLIEENGVPLKRNG